MFCPNYKNKEVKEGFNEIVVALGGQPLTDEEFRSSELRNKRTGDDYSAMETAYKVYHRNGGNMLDLTPNGKHSVLFDTLLEYFNGDRESAIIAKSNVYSDEFINWFGDWGRFKTMDTKNNLFTPTGEVNWNYFEQLLDQYHNNQPDSMFSHGRYTLATRPENHFTGEKNTLNHIKFVTQSMLNLLEGKYDMDLPFVSEARASMQNQKDLMIIAAMFHDAAKPYRHGDIHGWESADILRDLLGVDYDNRVAEWAVRHHMPMPFSHKAEFSLSNPEAIEVAKNIARDARRVGIDANTAINAFVLINAADVINGRELNVDDNWAKKAGEEGLKKYNGDISVKNVLSVELKEKVALLKKAFDEIKDEDFGNTVYNYSHQERFDYQAFPEGGREDKKLPYLNNTEYTGVSKVVDENGEPLVVWHGTLLQEFYFKDGNPYTKNVPKFDTFKSGFFTNDYEAALTFANGNISKMYAVYLNIKTPGIVDAAGNDFENVPYKGENKRTDYIVYDINNNGENDGTIITNVSGENWGRVKNLITDYIPANPNQIKHIENLGTFNPNDPNIYHVSSEPNSQEYKQQSVILEEFFGDMLNTLFNGGSVSTQQLIQHLLDTGSFAEFNVVLAEALKNHDIQIVFQTLERGKPMSATEYEAGKIVIEIDPEQITYYSQEQAAEYVLHEVVHGVSIQALNNPTTIEEKAFQEATNKVYDIFDKLMPEDMWDRSSMESGAYILSDKYEFAAVFATDDNAKRLLYEVAIAEDKKGNNKVFLRLKRFINALARLIGKIAFKDVKQDYLKLYEKKITKFLVNRKTVQSDKDVVEYFKKVLEAQKPYYMNNQAIANLRKSLRLRSNLLQRHYVSAVAESNVDATLHPHLWSTRIKITEALQTRLAAINTSTIDSDTKERAKQAAQTQVEQFKNKNISNVVALSSFIQQTLPQLLDDLEFIRSIDESSHSLYMYNMHDNFGAYFAIFNILSVDLNNKYHQDELEEEFKNLGNIDKLSATKDIDDMISVIKKASSAAQDGVNYMYNILMNNLRRDLAQLSEEINFSNTKSLLDSLEVIGFDTNTFINVFGSKDGAKDPIIRAIVYLVNKAIRKSQEETQKVATELLQLNSKLRPGESMLDLYELDDEGKTTQYLVRDLNFGKFYKDYKKFIEDLNDKFGLDKSNRRSPDDPELRKKWNLEKNKWLGEHAERRFVPKYYEAYAELSDMTLQRLQAIRDGIAQLKQKAYDEKDKFYHYERLTQEEWKRLQGLYVSKRVLGSDYTINGDLKIEGTDEYKVAKEIQKLNETLYSDETQIKRATEQWAATRNGFLKYVIEKNTKDGKTNMAAVKKLMDAWDSRNSKKVFKKEEDKLAIFKMIDEQVEKITGLKKPIYDHNGDGGATYEANTKRINEIIGLFRDYNTGEPIYDFITAKAKANIKQLEKQNKAIREECYKDKQFKKDAKAWNKAYKKVFDKYLKSVYTSYYKQQGGFSHLDNADMKNIRKPKWATKLTLKDVTIDGESIQDIYTELLPGDGWIDRDENNSLLNDKYDSSMGVPYIPKKEFYDNSIQYDRIKNSPTLKALYDGVVSAMTKSNGKLFNRSYSDNYQLPGMTGSIWKYMKSQGATGSVAAAIQYTKDHLGFTESGLRQDDDFGATLKEAISEVNDLQEIVYDNSPFATKTTGTRPDGRQFNIIPQYYTNKLDDPSQVSSDLIGIVCEYYQKACDFENKSEIRDYVESMVDAIEKRRYQIPTKDGSAQVIPGQSSKSFEGAKKFVEMNLYNVRSDTKKIGNLNLGKTAQNFSRLTQALNLGMSPAVALTGFFTAQYAHLINAIVGDRGYGMNEWSQATTEVIGHYIRTYGGVQMASNQLSNDKTMLLAEHFNVANQLTRKFKNSNRNRFIRFLDNWCFGGLTAVDFATKSTIMTTILMSHRYFRGKFLSKEDILNMLESSTEEGKQKLLEEWKRGKVLYSIFEAKNGKLEIDKNYIEAYNAVKNMIYYRINKTAENADGMATETQKAAITTNFFGAAILTHRQYLPLMIQQRFLPMVYDFDTQMYVNGQYIVGAQFFLNVWREMQEHGFKISSIINAYNNFTNDASTEESWKISRARKKALKKTLVELAIFNTVVTPLVSLICLFADGDDKKDWLALQLAAYIARRTQWEVFTPYRLDDMLNNIKSVSAQTGTIDKFDALKNTITRRIFPQGTLFDTMLGLSSKKPLSELIQRGVYQDHSRTFKTFMQLTPYHNLYEQWYGAKAKRMYYEKQIMKLDD